MVTQTLFLNRSRYWISWLTLTLLLTGTSWLLADDDDDDDDDHFGSGRGAVQERDSGRGVGEGREGNRGGERQGEGSTHAFPAVANAKWKEECSSCHTLYHPGLLPERSWQAVMAGLDKHFGENASLDPATQQAITAFLVSNAADKSSYRRSIQLAKSIPATATPLRVTETRWYLAKHDEIKPEVYKRSKVGSKANCGACHAKADVGVFDEDTVKSPKDVAAVKKP